MDRFEGEAISNEIILNYADDMFVLECAKFPLRIYRATFENRPFNICVLRTKLSHRSRTTHINRQIGVYYWFVVALLALGEKAMGMVCVKFASHAKK